ncbi:MAG: peptidoglycan editing factor PgeF [Proteobacteria bacterium]|nr:peptidoglycan editing factor PgeF [Pseudomonadota bacterium]
MTQAPDKYLAPDWPAPANIVAGTTLRTGDIANVSLPGEPCWLHQVHGNVAVAAARFDIPPDADASVSQTPGDVCVVKTADCLPVLLCSADGAHIGAAHAGWRGLAAGIIESTIAKIAADPVDLLVWLGPAISQQSFEVGEEVRDAFVMHDSAATSCFKINDRGRWQADLVALARQRLEAAGVKSIFGGGFCTYLDKERFFSYRRNPGCGRMVSFIARL